MTSTAQNSPDETPTTDLCNGIIFFVKFSILYLMHSGRIQKGHQGFLCYWSKWGWRKYNMKQGPRCRRGGTEHGTDHKNEKFKFHVREAREPMKVLKK